MDGPVRVILPQTPEISVRPAFNQPPRLDIAVDGRSDPVMVRLCGELDPVTAPRLRSCIEEIIQQHRRICLDVSELAFIDSSGINVLVRAGLGLRPDGWVRLLHPTDHLTQVIATIGLDDLLQEEDRPDGLAPPTYEAWVDRTERPRQPAVGSQ